MSLELLQGGALALLIAKCIPLFSLPPALAFSVSAKLFPWLVLPGTLTALGLGQRCLEFACSSLCRKDGFAGPVACRPGHGSGCLALYFFFLF